MKSIRKAVKGKVNSLAKNAEDVGEIISNNLISGSESIRKVVLETSEEEKNTAEGVVKDTINKVVETAETINGAVAGSFLENSKRIRKQILEEDEGDK